MIQKQAQQVIFSRNNKKLYKAFVRLHLNYADILHDIACSNAVQEKIESVQYNACLALTGATRGNSKEKLYQELDLESLRQRWWYRTLRTFSKFFKENKDQSSSRATWKVASFPLPHMKHDFFKNFFIPFTLMNGIILASILGFPKGKFWKYFVFCKTIYKDSVYHCHNPKGIKLLIRLCLILSHLCYQKVKHSISKST